MAITVHLPTLQNWSCHNCGGCCRQHAIYITAEERKRIDDQKWTPADGVGGPLFVEEGGWFKGKRQRLAHQADGGCVFLDEKGLCRIHAKFGEAAKPLACRIYPYAFHPSGRSVTVSLRYSCPSVVENRGKPLSQQDKDLRELARLVVPEGGDQMPAPPVTRTTRLDWPDFDRLVHGLDATFADEDEPLTARIVQALEWVSLIGQASFDKIQGERVTELVEILQSAVAEQMPDLSTIAEPTALGRMQFRLLCAQYARKDTELDLRSGFRGRWRLMKAAIQFSRGKGLIPSLQPIFRSIPFEQLEQPFGPVPLEAEEILTRYFRIKIQGLHFCGPAYYGIPFVEGFFSLALVYPVVLWIARWIAASQDRTALTPDDISQALAIADHHHGYADIFGSAGFRSRVTLLAGKGDIGKLAVWYSRPGERGASAP
jgi:lysine-N-methylase